MTTISVPAMTKVLTLWCLNPCIPPRSRPSLLSKGWRCLLRTAQFASGVFRFVWKTRPSVLPFKCAFSISIMYGLTLIHRVAFLVFGEPVFWRYMLLLMRMTLCSASHPSPVCWLPCESLESSILGSIAVHGPDIWKWAIVYAFVSALSVCGKSSVLVDTGYLHSRRASGSGPPQIFRAPFLATPLTATLGE